MKIQIDETGNFAKEVNPYSYVYDFDKGYNFDINHLSYPLTSPQVPLSVVDGELKDAVIKSDGEIEVYVHKPLYSIDKLGWKETKVYHIPKTIDGFAPNSEIGIDIKMIKIEEQQQLMASIRAKLKECDIALELGRTKLNQANERLSNIIGCPFDQPLPPVDGIATFQDIKNAMANDYLVNKDSVEGMAKEYSESASQEPFMYNIEQYKEAKYFSFIAGYNADKWVKVCDGLPENGQEVNVCLPTGAVRIATFRINNAFKDFYCAGRTDMSYGGITHWQPLPSTPKN